jgi:hypothetical protein
MIDPERGQFLIALTMMFAKLGQIHWYSS